MKTGIKVAAFVVIVGGLLAGGIFKTTTASQLATTEAKVAVQHYIDAAKSGNVDDMMKYTKDVRFKDDATKRKVYENLVKNDPLQADIVSASEIGSNRVNVTLHAGTPQTGTHDITLPVVKEGDQWKVLIEGIKVNKNSK